jgi:hypothetical protein
MDIEFNCINLLIIVLILVGAYLFFCDGKKTEGWTMVEGGEQTWKQLPRDMNVCDTGFEDEECKFNAINCLQNKNSLFYENN